MARLAIAVLCIGALVLVALIMAGSGLSETDTKVISSAVGLAIYSLTAVAGTRLADRRPELAPLGFAVAVVSVLAFGALQVALWGEWDRDQGEVAGVGLVLALAGGHASLLLASSRPEDDDAVRLVRTATLGVIALLAAGLIALIIGEAGDVNEKPIAVLAVLYILGTLVLPLTRLRSRERPARVATEGSAAAVGASGIDHVVVAVSDRARSDAFYRDVLGAAIETVSDGRVAYRFGSQRLNVHEPGTEAAPLAADPVRPGSGDICLVWNGSATELVDHLTSRGVTVVAGPVLRNGAAGHGISVHCRDPDGSLIELISYSG